MKSDDVSVGLPLPHSRPSFLVETLTAATYIALLAGQFGFERIGQSNLLIMPERLLAAIVLLVLVIPLSLLNRVRSKVCTRTHLAAVLTPLLYLITTAIWAPIQAELQSQIVDLICMILFSCIFVLLVKWDIRAVVHSFMWCIAATGTVYSLAGLAGSTAYSRAAAFGGGPNVYSRITVLGIVGVVWLVANKKLGTWFLAVIPVMLVATIVSGSRGGMLAGIVASLILSSVVFRLGTGKLLAAAGVASIAGVVVYRQFSDALAVTIQGRIMYLTFEQHYTSGRNDALSSAFAIFQEHPFFGAGLRAFATEYGRGFDYPHNLFAQVAAESGIVGVFLVLVLLLRSAWVAFKHRSSVTVKCFAAGGAVIFTSAMFSGGYYDARFLWIYILAVFASAGDRENTAALLDRQDSREVPIAH